MDAEKAELEHLLTLLRRRADDPAVTDLVRQDPEHIERSAYQGFVELKPIGVSVMFKEAPWVLSPAEISDPTALHVSAFHFHGEGHEGYSGYSGSFPGGLVLGNSEAEVLHALGQPIARGGGGISAVLKKPIPHWLRYSVGDAVLHFQLDANGRIDLVTLYVPKV
jgi:hypothetical protein